MNFKEIEEYISDIYKLICKYRPTYSEYKLIEKIAREIEELIQEIEIYKINCQ